VQGLEADSKNFRSTGLVLPGVFEGVENEQALGMIHSGANTDGDCLAVAGSVDGCSWSAEAGGQVVFFDDACVLAENNGAFDQVAELAGIARPGVLVHAGEHIG